jgi:tetratricopeptide (TPR) repeat protein
LQDIARVTLQTVRGIEASVFTSNEGRFEFSKLAPGSYQILVEADREQFEIATENVEVVPSFPAIVTILLKAKEVPKAQPATAISQTELEQDVPPGARKEFERATTAAAQGQTDKAIAFLRKAIALYPRYLKAHNDLGVQLLAQGKLDEAADELRQAIAIDSKAFNPRLNLGIVLVHQHRFAEADASLQEALAQQPGSPSARLYKGLALLGLNNNLDAERELTTAHDLGGRSVAIALYHLGQVYLNLGQSEQAVKMFDAYLHEAPDAANATEVKQLLAMLR